MKKLASLLTVVISSFVLLVGASPVSALFDFPDEYPYSQLKVNDSFMPYIDYGGDAEVAWESYGMSSCSVEPIGQSTLQGTYLIENVTSNLELTIDCVVGPDFPNWVVGPYTVYTRVLPPTFEYLDDYLTQLEATNSKLKLNSVSAQLSQAQRADESEDTEKAKKFLQKADDSFQKQAIRNNLNVDEIEQYIAASEYLAQTLGISVAVSDDGCSVTAYGPAGYYLAFIVDRENAGRGGELVIPESGEITEQTYAPAGFTVRGQVRDSDKIIYANDVQEVTDDCPQPPPPPYDPSYFNGYPEIWGALEPLTVIDDWGYLNRTEESYVAFRVSDSGRTFPTTYGEASQWLDMANNDVNVIVDSVPQAGDVAFNTFDAGEPDSNFRPPLVEYVESVDENGNMHTSAISGSGTLQEGWGTVDTYGYMMYIRFQ